MVRKRRDPPSRLGIANRELSPNASSTDHSWSTVVGIGIPLLIVIASICALVAAYRLAKWVGSGVPVAWAVLAAVPYIGILALFLLSRDALIQFRAQGVSVRLLGPRLTGDGVKPSGD